MTRIVRVGRIQIDVATPNEGGEHRLHRARHRDDRNCHYIGFHIMDDDVPDFVNALGQVTGTRYAAIGEPTQERVEIAQYVRSLRDGCNERDAAQLEAIADGILEQHSPSAHPRWGVAHQRWGDSTGTISCGPVTVDIAMCKRMKMTDEQIARLIDVTLAASRLENRVASHRQGMTRICDRCEQWTFPKRCHLCFPKKGDPT